MDIDASSDNAYVLVGAGPEIVAFGQALPRGSEAAHLARLIVNPRFRLQGIGRQLYMGLMDAALAMHSPERFTLNVHESNRAAAALYTSLGFAAQGSNGTGLIAMSRPASIA